MDSNLGPYILGPTQDSHYGIYTGDAESLSTAIPDQSIDLIITDPPYTAQYLHLYNATGRIASRVLKPTRFAFVYGGNEHEIAQLNYLNAHLTHFWTLILLHSGGNPRLWYKRIMSGYKPIYAFTNGTHPSDSPWICSVQRDVQDKRYHEWGQGIDFPKRIIDTFTDPGDVVLDLFCGGGMTPVACKQLGRRYLAFEIDADTAQTARDRVANAQDPLFIPEYKQVKMINV
ncbi:MAG: hypothetical protein GF350_12395 [Chitinivibrionales bacterium]|nr:hypothetical protein [Chitinivibrionales bacterium]